MFSLTIPLNDFSSKNVARRGMKPLPEKGSQSTWASWKSGVVPAVSWGNSWARERWQYSVKVVSCNGSPLQGYSEPSLLHFHDFILYTHSSLFF